jgi:transposase InsO family protein
MAGGTAMREWFTAAELADEALPGLPNTKRGVQVLAEREGWADSLSYARERTGRGGGLEYHIALLPPLARIEYERRHRRVDAPAASTSADLVLGTGLSDRAARERDARLAVVRAYEAFSRGQRLAEGARSKIFADDYNAGTIEVDPWVKDIVPRISTATLSRWRAAKRDGRADKLAIDHSAARKGKGLLETANHGAVQAFILGWLATNPALSAQVIRGYVEEEFGAQLVNAAGELVPIPPLRTFQHVIAKLRDDKLVALTRITNPDKYRSIFKLRGTGTYSWLDEPNQLWMIDASPVDALCTDGRWTLYAAVDVAPRRLMITLSRTPRASAVCLMLRKAILAWGVPDKVKTDNGSDFVAQETQRLFASLDIEPVPADAYCPDQKAHVERVIRTFQHEVGPQLPGYIGHSVAERKAIEDRRSFAERLGSDETTTFSVSLTAAQLQQKIDDWLEYVYHRREHGGIGTSPAASVAASTRPIARVDERALDLLLMPVAGKDGLRRMTAQGIQIDGHFYLSHSIMVGTDVFVRLDPIDMGKVYVFDAADGRFLDVAVCPALSDVDRPAYVKATKQLHEQMVAEEVKPILAEKRRLLKGPKGIDRTIALAKRKAAEEAEANSNVVALPKRTETHITPAIAAALDAMAAPKAAPPPSAETLAMQARLMAEEAVVPLRTEETAAQRWQRALDFIRRREAGEPVSIEEAEWFGGYREGAEYKARVLIFGDPFADAAMKSPATSWTDVVGQQTV